MYTGLHCSGPPSTPRIIWVLVLWLPAHPHIPLSFLIDPVVWRMRARPDNWIFCVYRRELVWWLNKQGREVNNHIYFILTWSVIGTGTILILVGIKAIDLLNTPRKQRKLLILIVIKMVAWRTQKKKWVEVFFDYGHPQTTLSPFILIRIIPVVSNLHGAIRGFALFLHWRLTTFTRTLHLHMCDLDGFWSQ